jgi:hypothetical protein
MLIWRRKTLERLAEAEEYTVAEVLYEPYSQLTLLSGAAVQSRQST